MGDTLTLDDGRTLSRSSMAIAGVLFLTAQEINDTDVELKRWLIDVSDRPNGFSSVDLRGLSPSHRIAFHNAARSAHKKLQSRHDAPTPESVTFHAMTDLITMLDSISRGDPPGTPPTDYVCDSPAEAEDLTQIWKSDTGD